jgi:hypothetical protein
MIWTILKWLGIVFGGVLLLLVGLVSVWIVFYILREFRKHRCPACGSRHLMVLGSDRFRTKNGADI